MQPFDTLAFLLAPQNQVFAIALGMLLGLLVLELTTVLIGLPISSKIDALLHLGLPDAPHLDAPHLHVEHDGHASLDIAHEHGVFGTIWDWLNAGRVPLIILIMIMLAAFGSIGYLIEGVSSALFGYLPTSFAAIPAFFFTIPVTRHTSKLISMVVPRDETYVVDAESLVGRTGIIKLGPLTAGTIARVMVKDAHGNQHFPWVKTTDPTLDLHDGDHVLLLERQGNEYLAIAADPKLIS